MALQHILEAIAADAESEAEALLAQAEQECAARVAEAQRRATERRQNIVADARIAAGHERARLLHRARLDNTRGLVAAQEDAFQSILRRAREQLGGLRQRSDYPALLAAWLDEALTAAHDAAVVSMHPDDEILVRDLLAARDRQVRLERTLATGGGVVVASQDGRVVVENTVEARLTRALPDLRSLLAAQLTGPSRTP